MDAYDPMYRTQQYPVNYYKVYPYRQPDDYYYPNPQDVLYYPARTSKYEVYQAVLPYYYQDRVPVHPNYKYYGYNDPVVDLQEEMIQEAEREQREDAQPIGHELLYESDESSGQEASMDDVNTAFLQNLIMSQMYQDAMDKEKNYYDLYYDYDDERQWNEERTEEDKDVEELKQLTKPQPQPTRKPKQPEDIHWFQKSSFRNQNRNQVEKKRNTKDNEIKQGVMVYTDRKPIIKEPSTSTIAPSSSSPPKKLVARGQKEEVLMRPATPVRRPFSAPVLEMLQNSKRTPSVYDTIKHMLDMEKSLENVSI